MSEEDIIEIDIDDLEFVDAGLPESLSRPCCKLLWHGGWCYLVDGHATTETGGCEGVPRGEPRTSEYTRGRR